MTKKEYARIICDSWVWDGADEEWLVKNCTKEELEEIYKVVSFEEDNR